MILAITAQVPSAQAQKAPGRFYAGVGINSSNYIVEYKFGLPADYEAGRWQTTLGYYITPRFALQVSYSGGKSSYSGIAEGVTLTGERMQQITNSASSFYAVPILVRYTLTKRPEKRLQFDVLAGLTFARGNYTESYSETLGEKTTLETSAQYDLQHSYFTAGVAARYVFSRHWELEVTYTLSRNTKRMPDFYNEMTGSPYGLTSGYGLNLRYRFGIGTPKPAAE